MGVLERGRKARQDRGAIENPKEMLYFQAQKFEVI